MEKPKNKKTPPFASGKVVDNYDLLFTYWRVAREQGREDLVDKAMLKDEDYTRLREIVANKTRINLWDLLEELTDIFIDRIDEDIAYMAASRLGYNISRGDARRLVARLMAAWLIEAGEYWNVVKIT
ncbi:MAG: hypothetical protein F7C82_01970 [Desulfurococcales archaeon]|nr:hypothetical protein [Desulfurococcales archaeon]MCE4626538.1 hypothetical protein [Desulfurococcales archaeon]MCE4629027.1 hypothetical protein [Desulfurococcales archaeon]